MPVIANLINDPTAGNAYENVQRFQEQDRASRLQNIQAENAETTNQGVDAAIRSAYLAATPQQAGTPPPAGSGLRNQVPPPMPTPPAMAASGPPTVTMRPPIPVTPAGVPPQAAQMAASGNVAIPTVSAEQLQPPGGATPAPSQQPQQQTMGPQQQPQNPGQLSPFDTPEFQQNIAQQMATIPGAGQRIMQMKADRDNIIGKVMEMIGNGHADEARYTAQRNGLQFPENLYQNADIARAMAFSQKAYPNEPDKGQVFFQAFTNTPGDMMSKVQAGIAAAGRPENTAQRELSKALALASFNENIIRTRPALMYGQDNQAYTVNAGAGTASPVTDTTTGEPFKMMGNPKFSRGNGVGASGQRFKNVGGTLIDTQNIGPDGKPAIVYEGHGHPTNPQTMQANLFKTLAASAPAGAKMEDLMNQAQTMTQQIMNGQQPSAPPAPAAPAAPGGNAAMYQEGATATNPQTGQKMIYQNGSWQPQ